MLCSKHSGQVFTADVGSCSGCASWTSSGMFDLCGKCSQSRGQCQVKSCHAKIGGGGGGNKGKKSGGGSKKDSSDDPSWIVTIDVDHYRTSKKAPTKPDAVVALSKKAVAQFKAELQAWLRKERLVRKVAILNEFERLGMMLIGCSQEISERIAKLPGVTQVSPNSKMELIHPVGLGATAATSAVDPAKDRMLPIRRPRKG